MKKIFFFLLFLFIISKFQSQNIIDKKFSYRITYILEYKPDSTTLSDTRQEVFYLYISGNNSKFISKLKIEKDSIMDKLTKENNLIAGLSMTNRPKPRNEYIIYDKDNIKTHIENIIIDNYGYEIKDSVPWQISDKKEKYETFDCNIATAKNYLGRNWTALYDFNIPLAKGPYKFYGLPGLVVKVYDDKKHYIFTLQKIEKITYLDIKITEKYISLKKREELLKLKKNSTENPFGSLPSGIKINVDAATIKSATERSKKNNNPIELIN